MQNTTPGSNLSFQEGKDKYTKLTKSEQRIFEILNKGGKYSNKRLIELTEDRDPRSTIRFLRKKGIPVKSGWLKTPDSRYKLYYLH